MKTKIFFMQSGFNFGVINDEYKQKYGEIEEMLQETSLDDITPIEALVFLQMVKEKMKG